MPLDLKDGWRQMRFCVPTDGAIPFAELRLPYTERKTLISKGLQKGGNPKEWFGVPNDIPLDLCRLEGLYDDQWRPVEHENLKAVFAAVRVGFVNGKLAIQGR